MKILQLHTGFNLVGGVESMVVALANEMSKNHDVTVCSVFKPNENSIFYTKIDERVDKIHLGVCKPGFSLRNIFRIYQFLRISNFDIVHIHGMFHYFVLSILLLHKKMKFIYTFHSDAYMELSNWDKRIFFLKKFCLKHKWMNPVTISPQSKQSFTSCYLMDSKMIENGIPQPQIDKSRNSLATYKLSKQTKVFIHPGRICIPKNQLVLCKVFKRLIDEGADIMLLIAGTKQDLPIFNSISNFLCDRIIYLGERNDVPQLLHDSDGFCLPSIWEGLPVTLLESLSVGCIPICSPVGGIVSLVKSGYNGVLSKSSCEEDYYDALKFFLTLSEQQIIEMKRNCLLSFAPYNINETTIKYLSYYAELLNEVSSHKLDSN